MSSSSALDLLLQSPSKEFVNQLFQTGFSCRHGSAPDAIVAKAADALSAEVEDVHKLFKEIIDLVNVVIFESVTTKETLTKLLPANLHAKLKGLIISTISQNLAAWRDAIANSQLSLPKLKVFDWRIDIKTCSDSISRMSLPTCIVQMQVEDIPHRVDQMANVSHITFEASKETLETMLDGLGKIRDQLESVATG